MSNQITKTNPYTLTDAEIDEAVQTVNAQISANIEGEKRIKITKTPTMPGMTFTGEESKSASAGGYVPIFKTGFMDTAEGWRLYSECRKTGDMRPYEAARKAWNSRHSAEAMGKRVLGVYPFTVTGFTRGRHSGNASLPPCSVAELTLEVDAGPLAPLTVEHRLFLHSRFEGFIFRFFASIGMLKRGEEISMDWSQVIGRRGMCEIGSRSENEHTRYEVLRFLRG